MNLTANCGEFYSLACLVMGIPGGAAVKCLPVQETHKMQVPSLSLEGLLE